ncbi:hypothetical protein F5Y13DRAFT_196841 [Hypoxylon sp. FL1857]|nr:hypothetical protein F5Y13DRAFT_196841 [Hypoxylon sp. FL1857]
MDYTSQPPSSSGGNPHLFWDRQKEDLQGELETNMAMIYFKVYGWANNTISPTRWRDVEWSVSDFAIFYDCPEAERAWAEFRDDYMSKNPLATSPSWQAVVDVMQEVMGNPEEVPDYMNLRPEVDKSDWLREDHWVAYILRLLRYKSTIETANPDTLPDFERRVWQYAWSFGTRDSFYKPWDASDKWAAAYLLYVKLGYERDVYTSNYVLEHPDALTIQEPTPEPDEELDPITRRRQDWINSRHFLTPDMQKTQRPPFFQIFGWRR